MRPRPSSPHQGIRHQCGLPLLSSSVFLSFNPSSWGSVAPKDPALHPARQSIAITQDGAGVQLSQVSRGFKELAWLLLLDASS